MNPKETGAARAGDPGTVPTSGHEASVIRYYDDWNEYYRKIDGFHVMLFEPGQAPDEIGVPFSALAEFRVAGWQRLTDAVTEPAGIGTGDHVVDAGCGFGADSIYVSRKHDCRVTGVNIVHHHLELARERAEQAGLADLVDFRWANCSEALPFEDASVDVVFCMEAACHFRDRSRFLREVARVLKPGGRLALEDFMEPDGPVSAECRKHIDMFCRGWSLHSLESRGSYTRKLASAGLDLVEYAGFGGTDAYNVRVVEIAHKRSASQLLSGGDPGPTRWHLAWASLALAWRHGHILHERFLARKP